MSYKLLKIALVHDYLNQYGGAERVLQVLCALFPNAPIYTTVYDAAATGHVFDGRVIRTSFLQNIPLVRANHRLFSFLMPLAVEQFDLSPFQVVLSVSSSFAKGIITKPGTRHVCYCLTPSRFLWDDSQKFLEEFRYPFPVRALIPPFLSYLRIWDKEASVRPDAFLAISDFVQQRIQKYYGRQAGVVYPPVNVSKFRVPNYTLTAISYKLDYFLMVGRMVPYKKFDMAVRVFNELGWPLKIVGAGPELMRLRRMAKANVQFLGLVDDARLADLYAHARAVVFPQEEDFGIVPLEAMASGRPVIAYRGGGALETIVEGVTGVFFDEQTEASLAQALARFDASQFDPLACRQQAEKFDVSVFQKEILDFLQKPLKSEGFYDLTDRR